MIKWRCALPQKNLTEGISAYAYLFMFSFFGGGAEKWGMKDVKNNDRRGGLGGRSPPEARAFWMPEREMEIIFVTSPLWIHKWNFDPPILGRTIFMTPPLKLPSPPPLINNDRPLKNPLSLSINGKHRFWCLCGLVFNKLVIETLYETDFMHSCVDIHLLKIDCSLKPATESSNTKRPQWQRSCNRLNTNYPISALYWIKGYKSLLDKFVTWSDEFVHSVIIISFNAVHFGPFWSLRSSAIFC